MDSKNKETPRLRIVRDDEADIRADQTPAPKSGIGKELTRFADDLDAYIQSIMNS